MENRIDAIYARQSVDRKDSISIDIRLCGWCKICSRQILSRLIKYFRNHFDETRAAKQFIYPCLVKVILA